MTNPERKAVSDERERLIRKLEERFPDESWADLVRADAGKDETIRRLRATLARAGRWMATHKDCQSGYAIIAEIEALAATTQPHPTPEADAAAPVATPDRIVSAVYGAVFAAMIDGGAHVTQARLSAEKFSERARPAPTVATREAVSAKMAEQLRYLSKNVPMPPSCYEVSAGLMREYEASLAAPPTVRAGDGG